MGLPTIVSMKQILLTSPVGRGVLLLRDKCSLLKSAYYSAESVGTAANDQMATVLITQICESHKTFIDVGAHIGSVISEVRHSNRLVKIVAVEADPEKAKKLRRRFPYVELHGCAAGESSGRIAFFIDTKRSGYSSLARPSLAEKDKLEINVPIERLDNLISTSDVDAIKIDVEGAELGVLRGAASLLQRSRPIIMFESAPQSDDGLGYTKETMYEFLRSHDFSVVVPNRVAHNDDGLTLNGFIESHLYPRRTTNYFAIPSERRKEFKSRARGILRLRV